MDWILIITLLLGFYMACNVGANDVANAMGTSVGSRALTLRQAVVLAAILEFTGALLLGGNVSNTIQREIIDSSLFHHEPTIFVLGMMGALLATGALLQLASYLTLPISTTHAIVGALVGFGISAGGMQAIYWKELGTIASSWILSPLLSGFFSFAIFSTLQRTVLFAPTPDGTLVAREQWFVPLQVISACLVAFAHGANDVSNAIGPVAAVINTLKNHSIHAEAAVPIWLLLFGGGGMVIGLSLWGWRVIETVGKKITELTPSRGFSAELGAAATILIASKFGLPISTTHALVGALLGIGMTRGMSALNFSTLRQIVTSWIVTIPLCALFSIIAFYFLKLCFLPN